MVRIPKQRTGPRVWLVGLALGFTVLCVGLSLWLRAEPPASPPPPREPQAPRAVAPEPPAPARPVRGAPTASPDVPPPTLGSAMAEAPREGVDLYRPGTKPLKQGLVVPEDFELPPGYVRHYQATDDGERVRPILMFHPDYKPLDSRGEPVELPSNRVVPPEMAPPGLPLDVLELPSGPEGVEPIP
ncbi:hypothetical protein [Melittangium boletus]|uniref:hypothetical protein n=1 Tax=Melittangium boletus TaxID=83453 RepID=UPI003DA32B35